MQPCERGEIGYRPGQIVEIEPESRHASVGVGRDAAPLSERRGRLPVRIVCPVVAAGGVVERDQRGAVAFDAAGGLGVGALRSGVLQRDCERQECEDQRQRGRSRDAEA